jgi:hypothetical protein
MLGSHGTCTTTIVVIQNVPIAHAHTITSGHWRRFQWKVPTMSIAKLPVAHAHNMLHVQDRASSCRLIPCLHQIPIFFKSKLYTLIYCRHFRTYSRCAMFDWSDTVFRRRNVTRRRISNTVLKVRNQPTLWRMKIYYYWTNIRKWKYFNTSFIEDFRK